jgi:hypothetical protein
MFTKEGGAWGGPQAGYPLGAKPPSLFRRRRLLSKHWLLLSLRQALYNRLGVGCEVRFVLRRDRPPST